MFGSSLCKKRVRELREAAGTVSLTVHVRVLRYSGSMEAEHHEDIHIEIVRNCAQKNTEGAPRGAPAFLNASQVEF